jgi:hypothetical protein
MSLMEIWSRHHYGGDVMKGHAAGIRGFMRNKIPLAASALLCCHFSMAADLHISELGYLDAQGLSVLVYQNQFHEVFRDQKLGGIEMILHGERIATDGEVRLLSGTDGRGPLYGAPVPWLPTEPPEGSHD